MLSKLYKLIFDISICYTIGAFLLNYFGGITVYGEGFFILLITGTAAILLRQKRKLKIATTILIPAVSLIIYWPTVPKLVVFLLIWAYSSYMSISDHLEINRGGFKDMLKYFLYTCLFLLLLMLPGFRQFGTAALAACPYLIVVILSAVFLLRHLRADHQMGQLKRYKRQQYMELLAFLIISILLTLARVPQNLAEGLNLMYQHVVGPVLSFIVSTIGTLIGGIIYLVIAAIRFLTRNNERFEFKTQSGETAIQSFDITESNPTVFDWIVPLMYSIVAIIGMILLFIFFRRLMGEKMKQKIPTGILETREYLEEAKDKKVTFGRKRPKDSRAAVRYYYGKCLLWLQHKHVQLTPQDTTEEINDKFLNSGQVIGLADSSGLQSDGFEARRETSTQLKQIYRKARYQMTEQITEEEAEKAKELYQVMKTSKRLH
jgi:hypothetical protein